MEVRRTWGRGSSVRQGRDSFASGVHQTKQKQGWEAVTGERLRLLREKEEVKLIEWG